MGCTIIALLYFRPDLQQGQFPRLAFLLVSEWTLPFVVGLLIPFLISRGLVGRLGSSSGACIRLV